MSRAPGCLYDVLSLHQCSGTPKINFPPSPVGCYRGFCHVYYVYYVLSDTRWMMNPKLVGGWSRFCSRASGSWSAQVWGKWSFCTFTCLERRKFDMYRICPYTSTCPNRCTCPCSTKHITSNSHHMPDKTSKDHPKTLKFERYAHAQIATSL